MELQKKLSFTGSKVDGDFGPTTEAAVRRFQRVHDMVAGGSRTRHMGGTRQSLADRPHGRLRSAYKGLRPAVGQAPGRDSAPGSQSTHRRALRKMRCQGLYQPQSSGGSQNKIHLFTCEDHWIPGRTPPLRVHIPSSLNRT
jgi:peptidoglycan hydrolase-like protein with peptidoglycan-binding domain